MIIFSRVQCFFFFTKLVVGIQSLKNIAFISGQHLQPWIVYIQCFDRYFYLRRIVTSKEHMQPCIWVAQPLFQEVTCRDLVFSRVLSFFKIRTCNRLCFQRYWVNSPPVAAIYLTNDPFPTVKEQLQSSISSMVLPLFHGSAWSNPLWQGHFVYFSTFIASIHYSKQSVVDSRKYEGYCVYLRKAIVALLWKSAYLFH